MKWHGKLGFAIVKETSPGVWTEVIETHPVFGDVLRSSRRLQPGTDRVNDNIDISNSISIVADPFVRKYIQALRYAEFMDAKWKVTDVEVEYPRLTLTLGGLYNGETEGGTPDSSGGDPGVEGSVFPTSPNNPDALPGDSVLPFGYVFNQGRQR